MAYNILNNAITPAEDSVQKLNETITELNKPLDSTGLQRPVTQRAARTYEEGVSDGFKKSANLCVSALECAVEAIDQGNTSTAKAVISTLLDAFNRIR